jgi:hypothetical protein
MTPPPFDPTSLLQELTEVKARLADLEATRRKRRRWFGLALGIVLCAGVVHAASTACDGGMPVCFFQNTPARADDVNLSLNQVREWIAQSGGSVNGGVNVVHTGTVRVQSGPTSNAAAAIAAASPFFVSGVVADGQNNTGGFEFRRDDLAQGIGLGFNAIYATGTNQDLNLRAKGTGNVNVQSNIIFSGYDVSCWEGYNGGGFPGCCRINIRTGDVACNVSTNWQSNMWGATSLPHPFTAGADGHWSLSCFMGTGGLNYPTCCRSDFNGNVQCNNASNWGLTAWAGAAYTPIP